MEENEVVKVGFMMWNEECVKRANDDVLPVASWRDMVLSCGPYLFLIQGVGELNNFCVVKRLEKKERVRVMREPEEVITCTRSVFKYLLYNGIHCVTVLTGSHHKKYDVLFRYFANEDIIKENGIYFVNLVYLRDTL